MDLATHNSNPAPGATAERTPTATSRPGPWHWPLMLVGLGLLANAAVLVWNHMAPGYPSELSFDTRAFAQAIGPGGDITPGTIIGGGAGAGGAGGVGGGIGTHGFYMMASQLGNNTWGLYLMDVEAGTICVYKASPETSRFRLMAVRYFRNDRFLNDFNNDSPTPREVLKQVEQQRQREAVEGKKDATSP